MPALSFPILAIDYGTKRVGLAIAHTSLAEPLTVVDTDEQLLLYLKQLIKTEQIQQIVVGESEGEMAKQTRQFVSQLELHTAVPIVMWDETLSTHTAQAHLTERVGSQARRAIVDHLAAAEILQDYLDQSGVLY